MEVSAVYTGAPAEMRTEAEDSTYALLDELGIPFTRVDHDAAYTMADCVAVGEALGADMCKNLLLTNRSRSVFYLLAMPGDKPYSTRDFSRQVGSSRLSFATEDDLMALLGVRSGAASVLALKNDTEHRVILAMDSAVMDAEWFACHPCRNTSSLRLRTADLLSVYLPHTGHTPVRVTL